MESAEPLLRSPGGQPLTVSMRRFARTGLTGLASVAAVFLAGPPVANAYRTAVVDVAVATLWTKPGAQRALDEPSLANPVDVRAWLAAMSRDEKRWLVGRLETQALYGEQVTVLATRGDWAKVAVPGQPTPRSSFGYPGWVPLAQLADERPAPAKSYAAVTKPTAWLHEAPAGGRRLAELAFDTRLPARSWDADWVTVSIPGGGQGQIRRSHVDLRPAGGAPAPPTGRRLVTTAKAFLRRPYVWAGTSAFAFDCSGLTHTVYKAHGVVLPRDASAQAARGRRVERSRLRLGDLLFYARDGRIHHVAMYVGGGMMIEAPRTGIPVTIVPVRRGGYWGARRYV